ncbi:MAG: response regulator transcription factor [Bacteroidota bacterium]
MEKLINVSVFEDNDDLRDSLSMLIKGTPGFSLSGAYPHCNAIKDDLQTSIPDVILMDIEMPGIKGEEGVKIVKQLYPDIEVIMLTVFDDNQHIFDCIYNGASGYLLKKTSPAKIMEAIEDVMNGGAPMSSGIARKTLDLFRTPTLAAKADYQLTTRETEVLKCISKGLSYKMVADELNMSIDTVRTHIRHTYEKLHVHSLNEAISKAINERLV